MHRTSDTTLQWEVDRVLNEDENFLLIKEVIEEEIKNVIWSGKEGKTLGPDGFTLSFFKSAWETVGIDVIDAIKHFFQHWETP